jgi:hypothetical protein
MSGLTDIQMASHSLAATVGAWENGVEEEPTALAQWGNAMDAGSEQYDNIDEQGGLFDAGEAN